MGDVLLDQVVAEVGDLAKQLSEPIVVFPALNLDRPTGHSGHPNPLDHKMGTICGASVR